MLEVPLYGEIGAGRVVPFIPQSELIPIVVPEYMADLDIFTLQVRGISLQNVGIDDGDILICSRRFGWRQITPKTICAVMITATQELVAKKIIREANLLTLRASGGNIKDLKFTPDDIEIKGIAIGFQRLWRKQ